MKKIENEDAMFATFTNRREGLYKKARELATECNIDIRIMMVSPTSKPHSFLHPIDNAVIFRFQNLDMQLSESTNLEVNATRNKVNQLKNRLEELDVIEYITIAKKTLMTK
uniref:Mads box protein n=1 Tax=Solanum tuberosum TaxID=4113 RepID=M1DH55_SOLTU